MFDTNLQRVAAVCAVVGASYAAYGAASFQPFEKLSIELDMCNVNLNDWISLSQFADQNDGRVVILDVLVHFNADFCNTDLSFRREEIEGVLQRVLYYFSPRLVEDQEPDVSSSAFQSGFLYDNGTSVIFENPQIRLSRGTTYLIGNEGLEDRYRGAFQIEVTAADAWRGVIFSTPILTDTDQRRIACGLRDWDIVRRALFCPLL